MNVTRVTPVLVILGVALASCGDRSSNGPSHTTRPSTGVASQTSTTTTPQEAMPDITVAGSHDVTALMRTSTNHPRAHHPFSLSVTVSRAGKPVVGEVRYLYLHRGKILARSPRHHFDGSFHDIFSWPSLVGRPTEFLVSVSTGKITVNLAFFVKVS